MSTTGNGFPWDGGDRSFLASDIASSWEATYSNGVEDAENDFAISVPDPTQERVVVGPGSCRINGRRWTITSGKAVNIPGASGLYTPGYYNGSVCIRANETTRTFELVTHYSTTERHPDPEEDEILIAEFYYWRPIGAMSTDVVVRKVTQSAIRYPQKLTDATEVGLSGLLKGAGGLLAAAVPYTDYLPGTAMGKEDVTVRLSGGVQVSSGQATHYRLYDLHVVLFDFTIGSAPSSPVQLSMVNLPPPNQLLPSHGGTVVIGMQTTSEYLMCGQPTYDGTYERIDFFAGQHGSPLSTSAAQAGSRITGIAIYY